MLSKVQGVLFLGEGIVPKKKKNRNIGIFCQFEITENKEIKGKTETKKDKQKREKEKESKGGFYRSDVVCNLLIEQIISTLGL